MAASKVPSDPNLTPEMRRFLDDTSKAEARLTTYIDDQIDANALTIATQPEAVAGVENTHYMTALRTAQAIAALSVQIFTKSYTSPDQTITAAGSLTLAHSMGAMPTLVQCRIKCTTAELGYSIGDELMIGPQMGDTTNTGVSVVPDATNINIRFASGATSIFTVRKDTGALAAATNASWVFIARAWA